MSSKQDQATVSSIDLSGKIISYTVRRSFRARHARLEIRPDTGLTVIIPRRYSAHDVEELLHLKSGWILKTFGKNLRQHPLLNLHNARDGDKIPYLGRNIELSVQPSREKSAMLSMSGDRLLVGAGPKGDHVDALLESWYHYRAEILFERKIKEFSSIMGIRYGRLSIRSQKTRWGSCSRSGTICLNWKLVLVPEPVIDYVVIHEIAHIKEMNHSQRFWQLVSRYCPDYKKYRRFLRDYPYGEQ